MNCRNPIDAAVLADYWLGILPLPEEEAIEEHFIGCGECSNRLQEIIALADGVRKLAAEGSLRMIVSDAFVKRAAEEGLRVREYVVPQGGSVQCTVTAEDDLLIGRLAVHLHAAARIDLSICDAGGAELTRLQDIPFSAGSNSVAYQESMTFAKAAPTNTMIAKLIAFDESGSERLLGEYTFNHTRTMPGPGAW